MTLVVTDVMYSALDGTLAVEKLGLGWLSYSVGHLP